MPFDVAAALAARHGEGFALHEQFMNRQLPHALKTVGFDRTYVRGEGCYLYDDTGQRYLDFLSGFGVYAAGRGHSDIKAALRQAIDLDLPNMAQLDCPLLPGLLAEQLVSRSHAAIDRVFFCNSGAEAVEAAIKFARHSTGRSKIVYAEHAFHGLTTGALALNGGREFRRGFGPLLADSIPVPFGNLEALYRQLRGDDVAAFVVEPVQGKTVACASGDYWAAAQEMCRRHGTLLVMDEVQTGLGRTGRFFCHDHWGLEPDIITVSKALSGGYIPVGAMLTTDRIFASVYRSMADAMKHSTTFGRNHLAMVAGLATLTVFDEYDLVAAADRTGRALREALAPLAERYEFVRDVRGLGLMIGIEFGEPAGQGLHRVLRAAEWVRPGMFSQMLVIALLQRHRIVTQVAADNVNVIKLLPPLIAGQAEIESFVRALEDVLAEAQNGYGLAADFGVTLARGALDRTARHLLGEPDGRRPASRGNPASGGTPPSCGNGHVAEGDGGGAGNEPVARPAALRAVAAGPAMQAEPAGRGDDAAEPARPAVHAEPAGRGDDAADEAGGVGSPPGSSQATAAVPAEHARAPGAVRLEPGDRVVVTGASGFIGSAVARAVRARGAEVVAVVEPGADDRNLKDLDVHRAVADIRDPDAVRDVCRGARFIFHLAAVYRFWAPDPQIFHDVNVGGTRNVLAAGAAAGCERLVYTSTVGVLGLAGTAEGRPADETCYADIAHLAGSYKQTKYVAEHEVLRAAAEGLDVSLALPTFPLGPGDTAPTPTGKVVIDFLNGRMPAFTDTAMNIVHVDDLASGQVAALERGARGRSYILGGENVSMRSLLQLLSDCTGLPVPRLRIPRELALTAGMASDLIEGRILGRQPHVPMEAARMSTTKMIFNDGRARTDLGYTTRPAREAVTDSARWFLDHGYVHPEQRARICWPP